jgi:glutamine cyclotransferase
VKELLSEWQIVQLTWQEKKAFIYNATSLKLEKPSPTKDIEGWGMTNDGKIFTNQTEQRKFGQQTKI